MAVVVEDLEIGTRLLVQQHGRHYLRTVEAKSFDDLFVVLDDRKSYTNSQLEYAQTILAPPTWFDRVLTNLINNLWK